MVLPVPKLVVKLFLSKQLRWEDGKIMFLGQPVTFTPYIFFKTLHEILTKDYGKKAIDIMYLAGWVSGFENSKKIYSIYKVKDISSRYKIAMDFVEISGVGEYKTIEFVPGKLSYFEYVDNPYGKMFYPSNNVVCHFIRGANAGGGSWVHKKLVIGIEEDCAARNGRTCRFLNITVDNVELLKKYKNVIKEQFNDIESILKFKIEYIKKRTTEIEVPSSIEGLLKILE